MKIKRNVNGTVCKFEMLNWGDIFVVNESMKETFYMKIPTFIDKDNYHFNCINLSSGTLGNVSEDLECTKVNATLVIE